MPPVPRLQLSERRAAAARRRRRRGQIRLGGLVGVVAVVAVVIIATSGGGRSRSSSALTAAKSSAPNAANRHTTRAKPAQANPLTTAAMKKLIAGRQGDVSAAVEDLKTHTEWIIDPNARDQTASIVKADILETVLYQAQQNATPITDVETSTAQGMIEASDNDDATALWDQIGSNTGLNAYNAKIGATQTTGGENGFWGETLTSAADQVKILRQLAVPGGVLNAGSKAYQLSLMEQIDPGENWGVTGGVPASGVTVALKNGWVPLTSNTDWEVNSIGWVKGDDHDYLVALLTAHDPSEDYGISTLDAMSKLIYATIGPAPKAGTATIQVTPSG